LVLAVGPASAAEYPVKPGESIEVAARALVAGDVLLLKSGVHRQGAELTGLRGTPDAPIVIRGEKGTVLRPVRERDGLLIMGGGSAHVIIENLRVENASRAGIVVNGSRHVTIRNCELADNGKWGVHTCLSSHVTVKDCTIYGSRREHGVYFSTTDYPVVQRCLIYDNTSCGIHMNGDLSEGGDGMITGGLVELNTIRNNGAKGGAAVNMDGVERTVVRDNLVFNNLAGGIVSFCAGGARSGSGNSFVRNTVVFRPGTGRFCLKIDAGGTHSSFANNVFVSGGRQAVEIDSDSFKGLKSDNNVYFVHGNRKPFKIGFWRRKLSTWQEMTGQDRNSIVADPMFVDPKKYNFRLKPGSPAAALKAGRRWEREAGSGKRKYPVDPVLGPVGPTDPRVDPV